MDKLLDGHSALQAQQGKLYEGQGQMESSLRDNLQRLNQEKALIASGQELVAQLIKGITQRMGESLRVSVHFILYTERWASSFVLKRNNGAPVEVRANTFIQLNVLFSFSKKQLWWHTYGSFNVKDVFINYGIGLSLLNGTFMYSHVNFWLWLLEVWNGNKNMLPSDFVWDTTSECESVKEFLRTFF